MVRSRRWYAIGTGSHTRRSTRFEREWHAIGNVGRVAPRKRDVDVARDRSQADELGNRMVDMQLTNNKLIRRGTNMLMTALKIGKPEAEKILLKYGSVRKALNAVKNS